MVPGRPDQRERPAALRADTVECRKSSAGSARRRIVAARINRGVAGRKQRRVARFERPALALPSVSTLGEAVGPDLLVRA